MERCLWEGRTCSIERSDLNDFILKNRQSRWLRTMYCDIWVGMCAWSEWKERFASDLESFAIHGQRNEVSVVDVVYCSTKSVELVWFVWNEWRNRMKRFFTLLSLIVEPCIILLYTCLYQYIIQMTRLHSWVDCCQPFLITILRL